MANHLRKGIVSLFLYYEFLVWFPLRPRIFLQSQQQLRPSCSYQYPSFPIEWITLSKSSVVFITSSNHWFFGRPLFLHSFEVEFYIILGQLLSLILLRWPCHNDLFFQFHLIHCLVFLLIPRLFYFLCTLSKHNFVSRRNYRIFIEFIYYRIFIVLKPNITRHFKC